MHVGLAGRSILIVDDEPLVVRALLRLFRSEGMLAEGAAHGEEARARLRDRPFDLVLSDVRMPLMDGPTLIKSLRADGDQTPLIFLTGYADCSDADLLAMGALDVAVKPTPAVELIALVRRYMPPVR